MTTHSLHRFNGRADQDDSSVPQESAAKLAEAELLEQLDQRRQELAAAAEVLRPPLHAVSQVDAVVRRVVPALPYIIAAITVVGVSSSVLRGKKVRPALLIATGLDLWRLWKGVRTVANTYHPALAAEGHSR